MWENIIAKYFLVLIIYNTLAIFIWKCDPIHDHWLVALSQPLHKMGIYISTYGHSIWITVHY